tara:strand:+ start:1879 stop:2733 length:855 start_codon:yes stop_codon:yes gene_type:complete
MIVTVLQNRCLEENRESEAWNAVGFEGREGVWKDNPEKGWKPEFINEFSPIATREFTPDFNENDYNPFWVCKMVFAEFQGQENTSPEWNIIEKSHRSLSVGDIVKINTISRCKFFMVEGWRNGAVGFSEFAPEEIAEDSSPDNGGDDRDAKIDAMQKQIDSLTAMVTDLVEANDRNLKRGHTLQGTHNYIEESNYKHTQRLVRLERFVNEIIQSEKFKKSPWQKENKELKERIEELEELNNIRHERIAKLEDAIGYTTNIGVHSLLAERLTKLEKVVSKVTSCE